MSQTDDQLPRREDALQAMEPALNERHRAVRDAMRRLRSAPPQVLLLEGGLEDERFSMALWYAALLNCPEETAPCLHCPICLQIGAGLFMDLYVLDGRDSSIKIDTIRELRATLGEAPRGGGVRVVIMAEAQALSTQAANALLKSLEEPRPGTVFLMLTPQRERLLPTLVSRSWALTLAWPDVTAPLPDTALPWVAALARFLRTGQGWFELTAPKGAVDNGTARLILLAFQKSLAAVLADRGAGELGLCFAALDEQGRFAVRDLVARAQESLDVTVNPALVLDWLATKLFLLCHSVASRRT